MLTKSPLVTPDSTRAPTLFCLVCNLYLLVDGKAAQAQRGGSGGQLNSPVTSLMFVLAKLG